MFHFNPPGNPMMNIEDEEACFFNFGGGGSEAETP
jgi:hypothetical protein